MVKEWRLVPFNERWVAEYGGWTDDSLPAVQCEAIAFVVAHTEEDAMAITEQLNILAMDPPRALGIVGRVKDGIGWLGPMGEDKWGVGWWGSAENWGRLLAEDVEVDPDPMPAPGKDVYTLTDDEREAKARWYERRGHNGIAAIIRAPWTEREN